MSLIFCLKVDLTTYIKVNIFPSECPSPTVNRFQIYGGEGTSTLATNLC